MVVPEPEECDKIVKAELGVESVTMEEICASEQVRQAMLESMNQLATTNKLNGLERVKKLHLHPEVFNEQNGLLTPS